MDGYQVMPMTEAAKIGDIFITVTGDINVIDKAHFPMMKDGAILANSGHFNVEINIPALERNVEEQAYYPHLCRRVYPGEWPPYLSFWEKAG